MKENKEKVSAFAEAVGLEIDHKIHEIEREIQRYRKTTLAETYEKTYDRMFTVMQTRVREIKQAQRQQVTQAHLQQRRRLISQRNELAEQLFADLRVKLTDFTESAGYETFLCEEIARTCQQDFPYDSIVVRVRPQDLSLIEPIRATLMTKDGLSAKTVEFVADDSIKLGGFLLWNPEHEILLDRTFEAKLAEQQQQFRLMPDFRLTFATSEVEDQNKQELA